MSTAAIRGEISLNDKDFAEGVKRVARGSAQMKENIESVNQADLSPIQRRIDAMFSGGGGGQRYTADALFSAQQRSYASGYSGDMRNVEGFKGAKTAAELRSIARAAGKAPGGAGHAMLEFGRAVEDAQYGLKGVLNNIPGILMGIGMRAGPIGAIITAVTAVATLGPKLWNWLNMTKETGEAQDFLTKKTQELAAALDSREKNAVNGSAEGQRRLAQAIRATARAYEMEGVNLRRNADVAAAIADSQAKLEMARVAGNSPEEIAKRGAMEIESMLRVDAEKVAAINAEMAREKRRVASLEETARTAAEIAQKAQADLEKLNPTMTDREGMREARVRVEELANDARLAKETAAEAAEAAYTTETDLIRQRELVIKTANNRIESMAIDLQRKLGDIAREGGQKQIDEHNAQMERHIAWKEQVDETIAKEKEREADREKARQREREASVARIAINEATARGDEKEAAALERKQRIMQRIHQLREMGFDEAEADRMANDENRERRVGRNGRPRIGRPGRGTIEASGINGGGTWNLDRGRRGSLRDELDARIGSVGEEQPRVRRVVRERESGSGRGRDSDATFDRMANSLTKIEGGIAQLVASDNRRPLSTSEPRNLYYSP
jgi:hypothetical protein